MFVSLKSFGWTLKNAFIKLKVYEMSKSRKLKDKEALKFYENSVAHVFG